MKRGITGTATNAEYGAIYKTITGTRRSDLKVDALDCERGEMPDLVDPWEPPYEPCSEPAPSPPSRLDLQAEALAAVIWCTGYRVDFAGSTCRSSTAPAPRPTCAA